ncbi:MAG: Hpt domain-containing protein [Alphaproteobacteria bacterium]|jgi:hypothetical protein|nr:Hpt domain-containing protein [Alphaproteobacteria bacterium]MDP6812782.1 Hpt domain-containing protein [Alphaproteobacteria bacterium]
MPRTPPPATEPATGDAPKGEIIHVPNKLIAKVGNGRGRDRVALREAEGVVDEMKPTYEWRFETEIKELLELYETMKKAGKYDLEQLRDRVHELRGEAGTFGYPLVSDIGRLLCQFMARIDDVGPTESRAIGAHLQAMHTVVAEKVKGAGPAVAKEIVHSLGEVVQKAGG